MVHVKLRAGWTLFAFIAVGLALLAWTPGAQADHLRGGVLWWNDADDADTPEFEVLLEGTVVVAYPGTWVPLGTPEGAVVATTLVLETDGASQPAVAVDLQLDYINEDEAWALGTILTAADGSYGVGLAYPSPMNTTGSPKPWNPHLLACCRMAKDVDSAPYWHLNNPDTLWRLGTAVAPGSSGVRTYAFPFNVCVVATTCTIELETVTDGAFAYALSGDAVATAAKNPPPVAPDGTFYQPGEGLPPAGLPDTADPVLDEPTATYKWDTTGAPMKSADADVSKFPSGGDITTYSTQMLSYGGNAGVDDGYSSLEFNILLYEPGEGGTLCPGPQAPCMPIPGQGGMGGGPEWVTPCVQEFTAKSGALWTGIVSAADASGGKVRIYRSPTTPLAKLPGATESKTQADGTASTTVTWDVPVHEQDATYELRYYAHTGRAYAEPKPCKLILNVAMVPQAVPTAVLACAPGLASFKSESLFSKFVSPVAIGWSFGDGSEASYPPAMTTATHFYGYPGTYMVTLTVVDSLGQMDQETLLLEVPPCGDDWLGNVLPFKTYVDGGCVGAPLLLYFLVGKESAQGWTAMWDLSETPAFPDYAGPVPSPLEPWAYLTTMTGPQSLAVQVVDAAGTASEPVVFSYEVKECAAVEPAKPGGLTDGAIELDGLLDSDLDGRQDIVDNCPSVDNHFQEDADGDGTGDACEEGDIAARHAPAFAQAEPAGAPPPPPCLGQGSDAAACDPDGDGVPSTGLWPDNCPTASNPDQADRDGDHAGDACDPRGDEPSSPAETLPLGTSSAKAGADAKGLTWLAGSFAVAMVLVVAAFVVANLARAVSKK